jgi:acyl-coenzyme A thioesterase PaaI-like protein
VRSFKTIEGVASPFLIPRQYEAVPGAAHGGIVAAYLDEVLAATVLRTIARMAVTGELTVRYVKPVPTDTPIIGRGSLVADHGRYVDVEGRLEELRTGNVLATARGRFFPIKP